MKLGVCYYPEHWPAARWPVDARLMRAAGLSLVRLAEFAWAQLEPAENAFDWAWLDQAIAVLAAEGLGVILGTPTAAPPAWLCHAYPEVLPVDEQGRVRRFGSRRHYCVNSQAYRQHTGRIVAAMAGRYGQHPAITGWQVDNEFGDHSTGRCYCPACATAFQRWLMRRYEALSALNEAWGTAFWSQRYSDWSEIGLPNLTVAQPNPSHVLDYYRFASDSYADFQRLQIELLRQLAPGKEITSNYVLSAAPQLDCHDLSQPLDFVSWDSYPTGYAEVQAQAFYAPFEAQPQLAYDLGDPYLTGFCHDLARGLKPSRPFWIMEQQCGHINWGRYNPGIRAGAVRLWTWHALSAGAETILYFNWRAALYGQEQYHSGLLDHSGTPAVGYADLLAMQPEHKLMVQIAAEPVQAQVALVLDYADLWALQLQPHHADWSHLRHLFVFYRALQRFGLVTDIVGPSADLSAYKLVIVPTAFLVSEGRAQIFQGYVEAGGHLLLGVRSGFKTQSNLVADQTLPGPLRELVGSIIREWHALPPSVEYSLQSNIAGLEGSAAIWAEALAGSAPAPGQPSPGVLASYTQGPFARQAALTEHFTGAGRTYYLGWSPSAAQAHALIHHMAREAGLAFRSEPLPTGLLMAQRGRHTLLLNFTDEALSVTVDGRPYTVPARDVEILLATSSTSATARPGGTEQSTSRGVSTMPFAVNGTLMRGLALNGNLLAAGAAFVREARTAPVYRLWSIRDEYPGMLRVSEGGTAIALELWGIEAEGLLDVLKSEPAGLVIGWVALEDGTQALGMLAEPHLVEGMTDITHYQGWRKYCAMSISATQAVRTPGTCAGATA